MSPEELAEYLRVQPQLERVFGSDVDGDNRTLLYGYDLDRQTIHVYLDGSVIHKHVYDYTDETLSHEAHHVWDPVELMAGQKRFYPERCDAQFSALLRQAGAEPCFTNFDERVYQGSRFRDYHGLMCLCGLRIGRHLGDGA